MSKLKEHFNNIDWEGIVFPLKLSNVTSLTNHYKIPFDSTLEIFRGIDYRLIGVLKCTMENPDGLDYMEDGIVKTVGFIEDEELRASDNKGIVYLLKGIHISRVLEKMIKAENGFNFEYTCHVTLNSVGTDVGYGFSYDLICDFYLCHLPYFFWGNSTARFTGNNFKAKYREEFDINCRSKHSAESISRNFQRDCDTIYFKDYVIVLQQIPKEILEKDNLPQNICGILIEYRGCNALSPEDELKTIVENFVSFIFGTHLQKIGTTFFDESYNLISTFSQNTWSKKMLKSGTHIPTPLNFSTDISYFGKLINKLFPNFYQLHQEVALSSCLWRLWIGRELAIGTNLPILSSGLEILVDSYMKYYKLAPKYTKQQQQEYHNIIADTITSLETKLNQYEFKDFVINKIKNPFLLGGGEKMKIFFNYLSFNFDNKSIENQALKARNSMAHGNIKKDIDSLKKTVRLSQAYISLIHRVILRLLNYEGYYIDYSKGGEHYKKMNENM